MIIIGFLVTLTYYIVLLSSFIILTPIAFFVWVFTTPFDKQRKASHKINCLVGWLIVNLNPFWKIKIHNLENVDRNETYIVAANHQTLVDIPMLSATGLQFKWVAKRELTFVPLLGWIMSYAGYVLLNRKDPKSQFKMMRSCENYLNSNMSIGIFPEGTRSGKEEVGRFRDGAALLARKTGKKILPVCMSGNSFSMPKKGYIWTKRIYMNLYFLDPIDPSGFEKTKEISNAVKEAIVEKKRTLTV